MAKKMSEKERIAQSRNEVKSLYCTECCTTFRLDSKSGKWMSGHKIAQKVNNRLLACTCNTPIGVFIVKDPVPVIGEVVAVF